jgi:hypothetical protein
MVSDCCQQESRIGSAFTRPRPRDGDGVARRLAAQCVHLRNNLPFVPSARKHITLSNYPSNIKAMNHFDHSGHEGMDHGMPDMDHGGHGGMDMSGQCSMNMIWYVTSSLSVHYSNGIAPFLL